MTMAALAWMIIGMALGSGLILAWGLLMMTLAGRAIRREQDEEACLCARHAWDDEDTDEDTQESFNPRLPQA